MDRLFSALAFDLGASSGRALIGELMQEKDERPKLFVKETYRFANEVYQANEHIYWDFLRLLGEVKKGIRITFREGYHPETIGIDTWGVDFGLLDANGELIGNPYHYRDPQVKGLIEELEERIGKEELFRQSGLQSMPYNTLYQLYAMVKANSPKLQIADSLLLIPDLISYYLTGIKTCEYTNATTTQLLVPDKHLWNTALMKELDIPDHLFLEPVEPGQLIGPLSDSVIRELGVPSVQVVTVGTHDTASAIAAIPAKEETFAYLICGTWSILGTEIKSPILKTEVMELGFSNEGGVNGKYQMLKNIMGLWIFQECKKEWIESGEEYTYGELAQLAAKSEPFRGLIHPGDMMFYSPFGMTGKIEAFCLETKQPAPRTAGEYTRCILESMALQYRHALEQAELLTGHRFDHLYMVGGGIQNELLCQFTANAIARPVIAGPVEASAIGNLIVQLAAAGHCNNSHEGRKLIRDSFSAVVYKPTFTTQWQNAYSIFLQLINMRRLENEYGS